MQLPETRNLTGGGREEDCSDNFPHETPAFAHANHTELPRLWRELAMASWLSTGFFTLQTPQPGELAGSPADLGRSLFAV